MSEGEREEPQAAAAGEAQAAQAQAADPAGAGAAAGSGEHADGGSGVVAAAGAAGAAAAAAVVAAASGEEAGGEEEEEAAAAAAAAAAARKTARKDHMNAARSRVLHVRNLPLEATESEIITLCTGLGRIVTNVLKLKGKTQAFIELADEKAAEAVVTFYQQSPPSIRGRTCYISYSTREYIVGGAASQQYQSPQVSPKKTQHNDPENKILLAMVHNPLYPVTVDVFYQIFSMYGQVEKIVCFSRGGAPQALVQLDSITSATAAKEALDGVDIYTGCCTLRIRYSSMQNVQVNPSNDQHRDYLKLAAQYQSGELVPTYMSPYMTTMSDVDGVMGMAQPIPHTGSVILVGNLDTERVDCHSLFLLFGCYGDVLRVKILYNKKDTALIQYSAPQQAQNAIAFLNGCPFRGSDLRVNLSKHMSVSMPRSGQAEAEKFANLTRDYTGSKQHRFRTPTSRHYAHICEPCDTLHLNNLPETTEADIAALFSAHGTVREVRFFANDRRMAFVLMDSLDSAIESLIALHDTVFGSKRLRVSFSKTPLVPAHNQVQAQQSAQQEEGDEDAKQAPAEDDKPADDTQGQAAKDGE